MQKRSSAFLAAAALIATLMVPAIAPAQVKSVDRLKFPAIPDLQIPTPTRVVLDNGMVVILIEDHELPLVDASVRIHTGGRLDPADRIGLASIAGSVMRSGGTRNMSGDELDDWLEDRAARVETGVGAESGSASMSCLKKDLPEVLKVFADVLRFPAFDEEKFEVAKNQAVSGISRQNDNPQQILFREFNEIIYGEDSPYAWSETYASINAITRDDLVAWHRKYFHPNGIILGLSGDFDTEQTVALVKKVFGDWKKGPAVGRVDVAYNQHSEPGVFYVEKNDMTQSNIIMGHLGIQRDNPDYLPVEVLNEVLSGGFAARLFTNVRSKKGLAYAVSGGVRSSWDHKGSFNMFMTTKTETTAAGIDALIEEARNITAEPPTEEEVAKAKDGILNSFVFNFDSTRKILNQQLTYEYYGYPLDWLQRYREGIDKVTTAQVRQVAAKYIHPDQFAVLVVGPAEGRDRPLSDFGQVTTLDISIPEPETTKVAATEEGKKQGLKLLARAIDAVGGAAAVDGVQSVAQVGNATLTTPQGDLSVAMASTMNYPASFRQDMTLPFGKITMVMTPDDAFLISPQGTAAMPDSQRATQEKSIHRNLLYILKARNEPDFVAVAAGDGEVNGTKVGLVQVEVAGDVVTLGIDPVTGHLLQMSYQGNNPVSGALGQVVQTFSDFRKIDGGLTFPFAAEQSFNGEKVASSVTESVTVNGEVDPKAFSRPEAQTAKKEGN
ncbi:MAG: M16 family metallopeptidase [Acidobacteriota bacterium]